MVNILEEYINKIMDNEFKIKEQRIKWSLNISREHIDECEGFLTSICAVKRVNQLAKSWDDLIAEVAQGEFFLDLDNETDIIPIEHISDTQLKDFLLKEKIYLVGERALQEIKEILISIKDETEIKKRLRMTNIVSKHHGRQYVTSSDLRVAQRLYAIAHDNVTDTGNIMRL